MFKLSHGVRAHCIQDQINELLSNERNIILHASQSSILHFSFWHAEYPNI